MFILEPSWILFNYLFFFQFGLDNESERRRLEQHAERLQADLDERLSLRRRQEHVDALSQVEAQIAQLSAGGHMAGNPNFPNAEMDRQLYHESMDKALSNSGPPTAFVPGGAGSGLFHQVRTINLFRFAK